MVCVVIKRKAKENRTSYLIAEQWIMANHERGETSDEQRHERNRTEREQEIQ